MAKSNLGGKGLFLLIAPHHSPSLKEIGEGIQGKDLEAGTEAEVVEE